MTERASEQQPDDLDDLDDLGDLDDEGPTGGLLLFSKQGRSVRQVRTLGKRRQGAAADAIRKVRQERTEKKIIDSAKVIREAIWLAEKKGRLRRASNARVGGDVCLEATVDPKEAPDGTAARFEVFQHLRGGAPTKVADLNGTIEGGRVRAPWKVDVDLPQDERENAYALDLQLAFRVYVKEDEAPSPRLAVKSFLDILVVDGDGKPVEAEWIVTLPHGITRKAKTDAEGRLQLKVPIGQAVLQLQPVE